MAGKNESTATWRLDVAQLKSGMQEAKRAISLANAEFKKSVAGMGDWSKSATGLEAKLQQLSKNYTAQKSILSQLQQQYKITAQNMGENSAEAQRLKAQMDNQEATVKKTEAQINGYNTKLNDLKAAQEAAQSPINKLSSEIEQQEKALAELKDEYASAIVGDNPEKAAQLASEIDKLSSELNDNKAKMSDARSAADELDNSLEKVDDGAKGAEGGISTLKIALGNLIADGLQRAISACKDFVTESIEVGKAFDKSMSNVAALSGASGKDLQMLRDTAKEYGSTTQFSASQAADALGYMALAGWDANQSADALGGVLNLAAASNMDLAQASDMVTDYLSAFSLEAQDSGKFADMLAFAQANANTTAQGLGEAFKNCAANMNAAGQDVETTTSLISMMANQGLKGSEAGTALSAMMRDMTAKMEDGAIAIGETNVQVMDAQGNYRDMTDILKDVEAATNGMGDAEKAAALSSTFTADSIKGLNLLLNAGTGEAAKFEEELRNSSGSAEEMAKVMNDNLAGDMTAFGSQLEGVQIALYEKFEPALRQGVAALSGLLDALQFLIDHSSEVVAALAAIASGVAGYVLYTTALKIMNEGWKSLTIVTKAQAAAQAVLNAVMAANPIGILIAAIAALVAAFVVLFNTNEEFRAKVIEIWENVKEFLGDAVAVIGEFFTVTLPNAIKVMINWFKQIPGKVGAFFSQALSRATKWASSMASKAREAGSKFLNNVVNFIKGIPGKVWTYLSNTVSKAASFAGQFAKKGLDAANKFVSNVKTKIGELPGKMLEIGKNIVSGIWSGISNGTTWIKNQITGWVGNVKSFIKNLFGIKSPSRVMRDEVGKYIAQGIAVGITGEKKSVKKAITTIGKTALGAVESGAFSKTGAAAAKSLTDSVAASLKADKAKVTASVDVYFKNLKAAAQKAEKKALKKTNSDKKKSSIKAQYEASIKEIDAVYKQFGKNVSKSYASAIDAATKGITNGLSDKIKSISSDTQKALDAVNAKIGSMQEKMTGYGDMFTRGFFNKIRLSDLDQQTEAIEHYYTNLEALRKKASAALVSVVQEMDINDSIDFADTLLHMSDEEFKAYQKSFTAKQNAASKSAKAFYSGEVQKINSDYTKKVTAAVDGAAKAIESLGKDALKGFMKGMKSVKYEKDVKKLCKGIVKSMKKQLKIKSPSRVFAELGAYSGLGYIEGLADSLQGVSATMGGAVDAIGGNIGGVTGAANGGNVTKTQNVTFNQYNNSPKALSRLDIYRDTKSLFFTAKVGLDNV